MIDFSKYGINYNPKTDYNVITNDLIAIGNIDRNIIDTKVIEDNGNTLLIEGEYVISDKSAVVGGEIIKVVSSEKVDKNTKIIVVRGLSGTLQQSWVGYNFRTVILLDENNTDIDLTDWSFEDTIGGVTNNLFPCELGSGSVTMKSDLALWSSMSLSQKYRVRNRKTVVYIFKGIGDKRILKFTTIVTKLGVNTRGKSDPNRVRLDIKTKLAMWYDKDLAINRQLKSTNPKEFFKLIFGLNDNEVYYANGIDDNSFLKINNLHTKEYKKVSEILKAYCSNGVRFCFDPFERVKIFSDFKVTNIQSQKIIYEDLTDSTLTEDEAMIYNTISTQSVQRQTMYNFEDLQNKYVMYAKKLRNAIHSDKFIKLAENGDYVINTLEIVNPEVHSSSQIGDIVCFKRTVAPHHEYYSKVLDIASGDKVTLTPLLYDKDFKLFYYGKDEYLYSILNLQPCDMDLYYVRQELPIVFKYTRNRRGEEKDSSLEYPILPKVNGELLYPMETNITFGCASNLKVGSYTGIIEEIDKIYGTWDENTLLYNREVDQFSNTQYPPIFALTNKMEEECIGFNKFKKKYTSFDNSNFVLEINNSKDNTSDATINMYNTLNVNKDIDLVQDTEIGRVGNKILKVSELRLYKIGDVLIVNKEDDFTPQEDSEFTDVLSNIRWTVVHKETQLTEDGYQNYIYLDSNFPKRQGNKKYSFTIFPNWSIVYLQELYFRGNPVIEFKQDVVGISKGVNYDGYKSVDIYGEKKYEFDSKQLDKDNMKMMMGYILDHFQAVDLSSTKFNAPITTFNGIDIELLDVVTVIDPTHTKINESSKWVVISVTSKAKTNVVQLKLLSVNSTDTKPFKLDIKDVLEYKPVEIPTYDHNGNEGDGGGDNDGNGGDGVNKSIGVFHMSEVDPQIFRARVKSFDGKYIHFDNFGGREWETYVGKLFPEGEFGISIDGETFLVQSDLNYRAFVRKRDIYNTGNQTLIAPEMDIKFLLMTSFTDIDGQFYSRRCMIGDGDTYFKFHPINGAKFVGDFVIGENNKNAGNDLWESLQKNRTFHQNTPPTSDKSYTLRLGDIWYDLDDENHVYRYNGDVWRSCRDNSIISTQSSAFIQPEPPIDKEGRPLNNGDTWYDSDDGYKPYVYQSGEWINVTDRTLENAISEAKAQADKANDKLGEIASDNKLTESEKQATKKEWDIIEGEYPKILDEAKKFGVSTVSYESSHNVLKGYLQPLLSNLNVVDNIVGENFRLVFKEYYDNRQTILNGISSKAKELADNAQNDATIALGNAKIFYQTTQPTENVKKNDMWYDTDDGNHPYIYNGIEWISARDKIFETEGGNRVYFQENQPPTSGVGVKDGDTWFKTDENNKMFILIEGAWVLADDAKDSIQAGRVVINGNTTFTGDAYFISKGSDETTIIRDGSISFTRGGQTITTIRNMRSGSITTDGNGSGYVDFTGMKSELLIIPSIQSFNVTANVRSLNCRAEKDPNFSAQNRYKFYVYGTQENQEAMQFVTTPSNTWGETAYTVGCEGSNVSINGKVIQKPNHKSTGIRDLSYSVNAFCVLVQEVYIQGAYYGKVRYTMPSPSVYADGASVIVELYTSVWNGFSGMSKTTQNKDWKGIEVRTYTEGSYIVNARGDYSYEAPEGGQGSGTVTYWSSFNINITMTPSVAFTNMKCYYIPTAIQTIVGGGTVTYLAIEQ